jgi:hypothetical protein
MFWHANQERITFDYRTQMNADFDIYHTKTQISQIYTDATERIIKSLRVESKLNL